MIQGNVKVKVEAVVLVASDLKKGADFYEDRNFADFFNLFKYVSLFVRNVKGISFN